MQRIYKSICVIQQSYTFSKVCGNCPSWVHQNLHLATEEIAEDWARNAGSQLASLWTSYRFKDDSGANTNPAIVYSGAETFVQ